MTCEQFQELLPEIGNSNRNSEYETHLRSCQTCWGLMADLSAISRQARSLQACDEPSPQVWNTIESTLLKEGIIRSQQQPVLILKRTPRWSPVWLFPVAASVLVLFAVIGYQLKSRQPVARRITSDAAVSQSADKAVFSPDDRAFLEAVTSRTPDLRAKYEQGLRDVNAYIHDAKISAENNPNDEDIQRYLMNAYDQKAMLYQMALDRSQ